MQAGRLRHRITIQRKTLTTTPSGGQRETWTNHMTGIPAKKRIPRASEGFSGRAAQEVARVSYHFETRFIADVTEQDRVIFDGKALDILGTYDPDGRGRKIYLDCVHIPAKGEGPA